MLVPGLKVLLSVISIILSSWLLIHLLGAFGIFLAFAYPIWNFLAHKKTLCIGCQMGKEGSTCHFCRSPIDKNDLSPKDMKSVFLNCLTIVLFSIFSASFIYVETQIILGFGLISSSKTVTFSIPTKGTFRMNELFDVKINIDGIKTPVNVVQADLAFDPQRLELVEFKTNESFANVFVEKEINNDVGFARLSGGVPNPGYKESNGLFSTAIFKAKKPGLTEVRFLPSSVVLANDGKGTNVLKELPKASYLILDQTPQEYESNKQSSSLQSVLGESTDTTKLYLYNNNSKVLGEKTARDDGPIMVKDNSSWFEKILNYMILLNDNILSIWRLLFKIILFPFALLTNKSQ